MSVISRSMAPRSVASSIAPARSNMARTAGSAPGGCPWAQTRPIPFVENTVSASAVSQARDMVAWSAWVMVGSEH
jgi:hypothetical protein